MPPRLTFSPGWSLLHAMFFGALTWGAFWLAFVAEPHEDSGRSALLAELNLATNGWFFFVGFGVIALWAGRWTIVSISRLLSRKAAVIVTPDALMFHPSFTPKTLSFDDIQGLVFDRADRLPPCAADAAAPVVSRSGARGARQGIKLRWGLRIYYRNETGKGRRVTIYDNVVWGGKAALIEFGGRLEHLLEAYRTKEKRRT